MQRVLALLLFTAATAFKTQCAASKELILPRPKIMERPPSNTDATPFGELKAALPQQKPVVEQLQEKASGAVHKFGTNAVLEAFVKSQQEAIKEGYQECQRLKDSAMFAHGGGSELAKLQQRKTEQLVVNLSKCEAVIEKKKANVEPLTVEDTKVMYDTLRRACHQFIGPEQRTYYKAIAEGCTFSNWDCETFGNWLQRRRLIDGDDVHLANNLLTLSYRMADFGLDQAGVCDPKNIKQSTFFFESPRFKEGGFEMVVHDLIKSMRNYKSEAEAMADARELLKEDTTDEFGNVVEVITDGLEDVDDDDAEEGAEDGDDGPTWFEKVEGSSKFWIAKVLRTYGAPELEGVAEEDVTYELLDKAWESIKAMNLKGVVFGGPVELKQFLWAGSAGAKVFWQFHGTNRTGGEKNGRGECLWTGTTDFGAVATALSEPDEDGKIDLDAYKAGSAALLEVMPSESVRNVRALIVAAFPDWNKQVPSRVVERELKRPDRFKFGTIGYGATSVFYNALTAHRLSVKRGEGALIKSLAVLQVEGLDAFAHLGGEDYINYGAEDKNIVRVPHLSYKALVAGFHVDAIDVAAMQDIQTIAISAIVAKAMKLRKPRAA